MTLPRLVARWMEHALPGPVAGEARSTCADCAMCARHAGEPGPHFRPDVKCCGFRPKLPNYLVGAVLRDDALPDGQRTMRDRLAEKVAVTPLGVGVAPAYAAQWKATPFGTDPALVCPHFTAKGGGTCTIWPYREAICTTWWCHLDRGVVGQRFWLALRALLECLQNRLARQMAEELGAAPGWGPWVGRFEAFYVACAERVEAMTWSEVRALGGFEARVRLRDLRAAYAARATPALPDRLCAGEITTLPLPDGRVRLRGWSPWDAVDVDPEVASAVAAADGATPAELAATTPIDAPLLQQLVDHGLLVPARPSD